MSGPLAARTIAAPANGAAKTPPRMTLGAVQRGKVASPERILIYGVPGVGKSTFAAAMPDAIFLDAEGGTSRLDVARFPRPESWADVLAALEELRAQPHEFRTVVLDTLDAIVALAEREVCGKARVDHIDDVGGGFGKGASAVRDLLRTMLARLEALYYGRGMNVVLVGHATVSTFKNPLGADYDRISLRVTDKSAGLVIGWSDHVLMARHEVYLVGGDASKGKKAKANSNGTRVIHTRESAAFIAKTRGEMPETLPLDWHEFEAALRAGIVAPEATLRAECEALVAKLAESDPERAEKARAAVAAAVGAPTLAKHQQRLLALVGEAQATKAEG